MIKFANSDSFQHRIGVVAADSTPLLSDDWAFFNKLGLGSSSSPFQPDFHIVGDTRLSDLCVAVGLCDSRSDFTRKLKEGAVKFANGFGTAKQIKQDVQISASIPDCLEIRIRRRCCEVIVPSKVQE